MEEQKAKQGPGRPRKKDSEKAVTISVTIQPQQKQWIDDAICADPHLSTSQVVRDALDAWHQLEEAKARGEALPAQLAINEETDDWNYEWL